MDMTQTAETHTLAGAVLISDSEAWINSRAARGVFSAGDRWASSGAGWVIENRDGSIVLARRGDTLVFDGVRITRR